MAWAGGTFTRANPTWATDASLGIGIEAGRHDAQDNDFTTGINQCLNKDGSNSATGNLNFGGYLPTNVAAGDAAAPAYCPGNDVNTGMYGPAADTLAFATNGSERVKINSTGSIGIGISPLTINPASRLEIAGDSSASTVTMSRFSADTGPQVCILTKSRSGTVGTNTVVQNGDGIGSIVFQGANGTSYNNAASIECAVDGAPGLNDMPGRLVFYTSPDGSGTVVERMRIDSAGRVGIGTTTPSNNLTVGDGTGAKSIVANGNSSGTAGGAYIGALLNGTSKALLGNYSGIIGGAYNGDPMLYFQGGTPRVVGIPAGVGDRFMKWDTSDSQWTYDTSSARFKENIVDSHYGLQAVLALQSREFDYKNPAGRHDVGFIAEEVVNVIPEVVGLDKDGLPEAVMYDRLTSVLCKAIQELNAKVEALEAKVADLEAVTEL